MAPEQSADPRDHYNKHTKTDRLDSRILARLPLLHPEGLAELAEDLAAEARLARQLNDEIAAADERITALYGQADPGRIVVSVPGLQTTLSAGILGAWAIPTGSPTSPACARSPGWSPVWTNPATATGTAAHQGRRPRFT